MFWVLNVLSGFVEVGIVLFGMRHGGIIGGLIGALCYQIGNIVPDPMKLSRKSNLVLLVIAVTCSVFGIFNWKLVFGTVLVMTMVLQGIRAEFKNKKSNQGTNKNDKCKETKRLTRIVGFALGFLFNPYTLIVCVICVFVAHLKQNAEQNSSWQMEKFNRYDIILFVHEMHYFVYCYSMVLLMDIKYGECGASMLFFASWILYVISPRLYAKFNLIDYRKTFLIGHSFLVVILLLMLVNSNMYIKIFLWILTGIGGTTEYCIGRLEKQENCYKTQRHNVSENLGHIAGVIVSIILYTLTEDLCISLTAAIVFVIVALVLMIAKMKEVECYDSK